MSLKKIHETAEKIRKLKERKNAIIIAHNYQKPEIQDIADLVADSLEMARKAAESDADIIVVCGVTFMAETAKILNPDRKVLIPDLGKICTMAEMLTPNDIKEAKRKYKDAEVALYVNSTATCKALADVCVTSANAAEIVNKLNSDTVIFAPDKNLAHYVSKRTDRRIINIPKHGVCPVHHMLCKNDVLQVKSLHKNAKVVAHPECKPEVQEIADHIASTEGMVKYCSESEHNEFIICTEEGLLYKLSKRCPDKRFHLASKYLVCSSMKITNLKILRECLEREKYEIKLDKTTIKNAQEAINRMLELA